ncbi:MAG: hypothetical protein IPJ74_25185 [Saprospiraceae bacterium]|nr:hypothetical protein [Saprospiraceae bacterium]
MDEEFSNLYDTEEHCRRIAATFAGLAIFIACLGLFGLTAFAAHNNTKEISVRKVLGATITDIITFVVQTFYCW